MSVDLHIKGFNLAQPIMHFQDGGMHVAFDQNKLIYFENQARYGIL
jgi:hypothetical protein